jgi:hypothetical protein
VIDRRAVATLLWLLFAFLVWNIRFDHGVRLSATAYLSQRGAYLRGNGPKVEISSSMRAGIARSAKAATLAALPAAGVSLMLAVSQRRKGRSAGKSGGL